MFTMCTILVQCVSMRGICLLALNIKYSGAGLGLTEKSVMMILLDEKRSC